MTEPEKLSRAEAGRKGGRATKQRHGTEHFKAIGTKGGAKGGAATRDKYGVEFFRTIGAKGGAGGRGRGSQGSTS
jgi:uncharacterized protein